MRARHLVRRFVGSWSRAEPSGDDVEWAHSFLSPAERSLWDCMSVQDRRHSLQVARRFVVLASGAGPEVVAGVLLHDVGKQVAGLGTVGRVVATVVGPRTRRFRQYHDHESLGAAMLRGVGSHAVTVETVCGGGPHAPALRAADDV